MPLQIGTDTGCSLCTRTRQQSSCPRPVINKSMHVIQNKMCNTVAYSFRAPYSTSSKQIIAPPVPIGILNVYNILFGYIVCLSILR